MGTNYYWDFESCEHCGRSDEKLHVGKASGGWKFYFRGYEPDKFFPESEALTIKSWQSWKDWLRAQKSGSLVDEYGDTENLEKFIAEIDARQKNPKLLNHGVEHPSETTILDDKGNTICFHWFC